jgi:glycine dehydrogenase subunit 1
MTHPYIPNTAPDTRARLLAELGLASTEELYADIPAALRLRRPLDLPPGLPAEQDLDRHVTALLDRNRPPRLSFLGRGTYAHYVPAVVDEVISRSEFLTAYAGEPYEDHGRFQALFEYQSLMGELLACDVVTVPTYDGFQATATAIAMAGRVTRRPRIVAVSDVLPGKRSRVADFVAATMEVTDAAPRGGTADLAAAAARLGDDVAAIWVETPSAVGALEPALPELARLAHACGALLVVGTDPICYGVLTPPSEQGADIVAGDIGSLGLHPYCGGAHGGFLAVADDPALVMQLPSRIFGLAATDLPGELGFGDVAYGRTSFALREEGVEWVGTAAALWGIAAGVYLALMGPLGLAELGETILSRTRYAAARLGAIPGFTLTDDAVHFREFAVDTGRLPATEAVRRAHARGIDAGVTIGDCRLAVCVTEQHTAEDIDRLADTLAAIAAEYQEDHR